MVLRVRPGVLLWQQPAAHQLFRRSFLEAVTGLAYPRWTLVRVHVGYRQALLGALALGEKKRSSEGAVQ